MKAAGLTGRRRRESQGLQRDKKGLIRSLAELP